MWRSVAQRIFAKRRNHESQANGQSGEHFHTLSEVAKLLNVSRTTVYRWWLRGLGAVRISGVVRIGESSLRQFIAQHHTQGETATVA